MNSKRGCQIVGSLGVYLLLASTALAQKPPAPKPSDSYDELFARYLAEARASAKTENSPDAGWSWLSGLALDHRARRVNDLVTINVVENITASGSADSALAKASTGAASITSLFGLEKKLPSI